MIVKTVLLYFFIHAINPVDAFAYTTNQLAANPAIIPIKSNESIPQGKMTFELYVAEFNGRLKNLPVEIEITGDQIIIFNTIDRPLSGGEIITKGIILKHITGVWILATTKEDANALEIGGCTSIPIIDFESKIIEWC